MLNLSHSGDSKDYINQVTRDGHGLWYIGHKYDRRVTDT